MLKLNSKVRKLSISVLILFVSLPIYSAEFIVQTNLELPPDGVANEISPGVYTVQTLRSAISLANNENDFPGSDTISFDFDTSNIDEVNQIQGGTNTIVLGFTGDQFNFLNTSSPSAFGIDSTIIIDGDLPGTQKVTLSTTGLRHFQVNTGGRLRLKNLSIKDGETPLNSSGRGGAVVVQNSAQLEVDNCDFSFNQAVNGGAIAIQSGAMASQITNSLFLFNSASDEIPQTDNGAGGALFAANNVFPLLLENNSFTFNGADANGGAIYLSGVANLERVELFNNDADLSGGGLFLDSNGSVSILNSLIYDNFAAELGGGLSITGTADAEIINVTITKNRAGNLTLNTVNGVVSEQGGGIFINSGGDLLLHNSIISENLSLNNPVDITGSVNSQSSHNLIGVDVSLQNITHGNNGNLIGTELQPIDAMIQFNFLQRVEGLAYNSPAIDAGDNNIVSQYNMTTDYRGNGYPRILGSTVDIGAFEMDYIFINGFE
ncbi:MAG: choice-of-anchor Q domain-containing protein [Marinicella sp.]